MSDLLPSNATAPERALSLAIARQGDVPIRVREMWSADSCPENLLAWLAWAFGVDEWDTGWTDIQKRAVIKRSVEVHRHKGTIGAVRDALGALIVDSRVQEWFNQTPSASAYTFRVLLDISQDGVPQSAINAIAAVIDRTKNLRSHLDRVELYVKSNAPTFLAAVGSVGSDIVINNYVRPLTVINQTALVL